MAALGSPGVQVTVIDESFYTSAASGTVPIIFVATAENKRNASATGVAQGTLAANVGKVYAITGQRDLTDTFGTPLFYTDSNNNPIHGGEQNEYGLQAAYSLLGASSRAYIVRADVNLAELSASTSVPTGTPVAGTYWVDTASTIFGVSEWQVNVFDKGSFVNKPVLVIDDSTSTDFYANQLPTSSFGNKGDYAMVVTYDNDNKLFYKTNDNVWVHVTQTFDRDKIVTISPHTSYPNYTAATPAGSIWIKTTTPGRGANWAVKYFSGVTQVWATVPAPMYSSTQQALQALDNANGGLSIPVGSLFVESNADHYSAIAATFKIWRRSQTGPTVVTSGVSTALQSGQSSTFMIKESLANSTAWGPTVTVTIPFLDNNTTVTTASLIPAAISAAGLTNVSAVWDRSTNMVTFSHKTGGDFMLGDGDNGPLIALGFTRTNLLTSAPVANLYVVLGDISMPYLATNWKPLVYEARKSAPVTAPADGTLWYDANFHNVDIMINDGAKWVGYASSTSPYHSVSAPTDPLGPIVSASAPTTQQNTSRPLVNGDVWINTSNTEMYGSEVYVYESATLSWILQNVTDHSSPDGWVFADARWSTTGGVAGKPFVPATIAAMLTSNYVDPDCVDAALYPKGTKLWNLRRSGFNVKKYVTGKIDVNSDLGVNLKYNSESKLGYVPDRWVHVSANDSNGVGTFGRFAQRSIVVSALKQMITTNTTIRDTDTLIFNLTACPGYPETIANMVEFNNDIGQTSFVVGDTPFRLRPTGTELSAWGNNTMQATDNGDDGAVSYDNYMSMFYPSGYTTDNVGNNIVVPASHMMLRTIANSDSKSYQWFAPAGTRRGVVDNVTSVGYVNDVTGNYEAVSLHESLRTVLHDVKINPIATLPGSGIVNMGQYTRALAASSLDRINVARLVGYLRRQLGILAKPYLFEPNDVQTRTELKSSVESLLIELVGQRAIYDFAVRCDSSNNTSARIDRNELWLDIAIEPVKSVEMIYIPLRLKNTGAISAGL